jgi:hypothetical protein
MNPMFEREKTVHALDPVATVIGMYRYAVCFILLASSSIVHAPLTHPHFFLHWPAFMYVVYFMLPVIYTLVQCSCSCLSYSIEILKY